jgi:hypothetical protein
MISFAPYARQCAAIIISTFPFFLACFAQDNGSSSSSGTSAAVIAALGTILGYLGSEAVDESIFERLLWPERFYNTASPLALLKIALCLPMGGPLHTAAIHTLKSFHEHNLYRGARKGDMLGSPFYNDLKATYVARSDEKEATVVKQARNALLIRILRLVVPRSTTSGAAVPLPPRDSESQPETIRTTVYVQHLRVRCANAADVTDKKYVRVNETLSWRTALGLLCSEGSGIIFALIVGFGLKSWFGLWWCAPLFLKILAAFFRVRRQPLETVKPDSAPTCMFDAVEKDRWFFLIEGPDHVVRQFFRHYGHPIRDSRDVIIPDRMREVVSMCIVVLYGTIFPVGLLVVTLWLDVNVQFVWLGYQLWSTLVMLIARLADGSRWGSTEERIAGALSVEKQVVFERQLVLRLDTTTVNNVDMARAKIAELLRNHALARNNADSD